MTSGFRVLLILGAGSNIGRAVASKFLEGGYKVALVARRLEPSQTEDGILNIRADLTEPQAVVSAFETTGKVLGVPNIVLYNVANRQTTPVDDPASASLDMIEKSRKASLDSAYIAAQESLKGFYTLPAETPKAFLYTGNTLNQIAIPGVLPHALGKVAAAMMIEYAANAYGSHGHRFYYIDQRKEDGLPAGEDVNGSSHAGMYWELAHETKQTKWLATFVHGEGRRDFVGVDFDGQTRESTDRRLGRI